MISFFPFDSVDSPEIHLNSMHWTSPAYIWYSESQPLIINHVAVNQIKTQIDDGKLITKHVGIDEHGGVKRGKQVKR